MGAGLGVSGKVNFVVIIVVQWRAKSGADEAALCLNFDIQEMKYYLSYLVIMCPGRGKVAQDETEACV